MFHIPNTWNNSTNSTVFFVVNVPSGNPFTTDPHWFVDVKGYKGGEIPSATWNIYSADVGTFAAAELFSELTSGTSIKFDAGDLVVARLKFDGNNDEIVYIYDAYITYS